MSAFTSLLKKSKRIAHAPLSFEQSVMTYFGVEQTECPTAALEMHTVAQKHSYPWWLKMVPTNFQVGNSGVYLTQSPQLTKEEAEELIDSIRPLLPENTFIHMATPNQWYLNVQKDPMLQTYSFDEVVMKEVKGYLPQGKGRAEWHRLMTEIQMAFHQSRVNQKREEKRLPLIDGVWVWGSGKLPELSRDRWTSVFGDHLLVQGLGRLANIAVKSLPENVRSLLPVQPGETLLVEDSLSASKMNANEAAENMVTEWLKHWLEPLVLAVRKGQIDELILDFCQGEQYHMTSSWKRFWPFI